MDTLNQDFPGVFNWAGEINVFKHALAGNGFFDGQRVTVAQINSGSLDSLFQKFEDLDWTVTLHCDLGCDNYDAIPPTPSTASGCTVSCNQQHPAQLDQYEC